VTIDDERRAIRHELESMKASGVHRRELSLHACKRLFFDLGVRPSMATVRELTQTGSASDIPKDIDHFWERIREASQARIGAGAIPPALEEKAGELLGELFRHALTEAQHALDAERQEMHIATGENERRLQEAEIRRQTSDEALQRSEARAEAAWDRIRELETELAASATRRTSSHEALHATVVRLDAENANLVKRLEAEMAANAALRERTDGLQVEMRQNAEHYAAQIKDAIAEAERRVKPMLVELDSLRNMAATYQAGIRDASRKEFDFIQQLSVTKSKADRLDERVRDQSDEIDALTLELDTLRAHSAVAPEVASVICSMAQAGRLDERDFAALGTALDNQLVIPGHCPKCKEGEPELAQAEGGYELLCPECDHCSGIARSRLEAFARFGSVDSAASLDKNLNP
jgi:Plasmid replication region DNA-binding N-term